MAKTIPLANLRGEAIVSDEDLPRVSQHPWRRRSCGTGHGGKPLYHAATNLWIDGKKITTTMHRFIMGALPGEQVDHINGDGLDNRRENLRLWKNYGYNAHHTYPSQVPSSLGYRGVQQRPSGRYRATLWHNGKTVSAGTFDNLDDALLARDQLALKLRNGETALNFPVRPPNS